MNDLITKLYHHATRNNNIHFQRYAISKLKSHINFDKAIWMDGEITNKGARIYRYIPFGIKHETENSFVTMIVGNRLLHGLLQSPGKAINIDLSNAISLSSKNVCALMRKSPIEQALIMLTLDGETNSLQILAISRLMHDDRFNEDERKHFEKLIPYVTSSYELFKHSRRYKQLNDAYTSDYSIAHADTDGTLIYRKPDFIGLMQLEWPQWTGPKIPDRIYRGKAGNYPYEFYGAKICVKLHLVGKCIILSASEYISLEMPSNHDDQLTENKVVGKSLFGFLHQ